MQDLRASLNGIRVDCLDRGKKLAGKDVTTAVINLTRLHRKLAQLHIKMNEDGSEPSAGTNPMMNEKTTTSTGPNAEDIIARLPIIAQTNNGTDSDQNFSAFWTFCLV